MIKHVVCFQLKDHSPEILNNTKDILLSMRGNVPSAKEIQVGVDFLHSPRSYDIILEVTLDSREDLDVYQNDPYHVDVVKQHMHQVMHSSIAIDYDIE